MNIKHIQKTMLRFAVSAVCALIAMGIALFLWLHQLPVPAYDISPAAGHAFQAAKSEALFSTTYSETEYTVYIIYSTVPGGSETQREMTVHSVQELEILTPEAADGYIFHWLLDGEEWNGDSIRDGMSLTGIWVPVYDVVVY